MTSQKDSQKDSQKFDLYNFITQDLKLNANNINYYEAPSEVTYEMLENIFKDDLDYQYTLILNKSNGKQNIKKNVNFLWTPYAKIMFPKNNFGIYYDKNELEKIQQLRKTDNKIFPIGVIETQNKSNIPELPNEQRLDIKYSKLFNKKKFNNIIFKNKIENYENEGIGNEEIGNHRLKTGGYVNLGKTNRSIKLKRKLSKKKVQNGGVRLPNLDIVPANYPNTLDVNSRPRYQELYNFVDPVGNTPTNMFGMSIPENNNRIQLLQQFGHLMYNREIKIIIDLHSCGTGLHPRAGNRAAGNFEECNQTGDINCERETWEFLKKLHLANIVDPDIRFYNYAQNIGIEDMTSGTVLAWINLSRIDVNILPLNTKKFAIHCQAGFGRTGSVMLLYILKYLTNRDTLMNECFGLIENPGPHGHVGTPIPPPHPPFLPPPPPSVQSDNFYILLRQLLLNAGVNDQQVNEVLNIRDLFHARLLIARINNIIVSLALIHGLVDENIYLYSLNISSYNNPDDLFVPVGGRIGAVQAANPHVLQNDLIRESFLL
jgi:hypothetical protein